MSARNGDKARFGKQRKRKMAQRARTQQLREELAMSAAAAPTSAHVAAPSEPVLLAAPETHSEPVHV